MTKTPTTDSSIIDARLFGSLARLWIAEPDESVLQNLNEAATQETWQSLGGFVPSGETDSVVDDLGSQYCACFLGPKGHLPPHQSVVEQSHFQGECLSSLNRFVEVVGLPDGELFKACHSMPDHIGILLGMMQMVCQAESDSLPEEQSQIAEIKRSFFDRHLAWILNYCDVAASRTSSDFYRGLFAVTQAWLKDVQQRMTES